MSIFSSIGKSSPHTRGCFQLSTGLALSPSSPHTRGCFLILIRGLKKQIVFPAYAGVFLLLDFSFQMAVCLPRIRGGVSTGRVRRYVRNQSSPHTRGCFYLITVDIGIVHVFPAYAGVFPSPRSFLQGAPRLPRIRGGVSPPAGTRSAPSTSSPHTRGCFSAVLSLN